MLASTALQRWNSDFYFGKIQSLGEATEVAWGSTSGSYCGLESHCFASAGMKKVCPSGCIGS